MKKFLSLCLLMLAASVGTAQADYYVGARLTVSDVQDGDLVILEAASTPSNYGYYIKETTDGYFWKEGLGDNCVWRLISTGDADTYYFQNVSTGNYISGNGYTVADCKTVNDLASAAKIKLNGWNSSWFKYTSYPQGWDQNSTIISMVGGGNYGNRVYSDAKNNGTFNRDGLHCDPYNIFRVSESEGIAFSAMTNTSSGSLSGIVIDGLTYDLSSALRTPTGQIVNGNTATLTVANKNLNVESVNIPATVTYDGLTYRVTLIENAAFQGGKFSTLTFDNPTNLTALGDWTFAQCSKLVEVEVPEGIHTLSYSNAFGHNSALETVTLPTTIRTLAGWSFGDDKSLTTVIFKGSTPPTSVSNDVFTSYTVPGNITIVVPNEEDIAAYQAITAFTNHPTEGRNVKQIISYAKYLATFDAEEIAKQKNKIQKLVDLGFVVNGVKDAATKAELEALIANEDATLAEVNAVVDNIDDYKMKLADGYYRIMYPTDFSGNPNGNGYVRFGSDKMLYADCEEDYLNDYSTVFKITLTGESVSHSTGDGSKVKMTSQNLAPTSVHLTNDRHQKMDDIASQYAVIINQTAVEGACLIGISDATGGYESKYIYKKPVTEDYKVHQTGGNYGSSRCFIYPATNIAIKLHSGEGEYWATFYAPFGVTLPDGTQAYTGVINTEESTLELTSIGQNVPAGTPVVLKGNAASISATINDAASATVGTNDLQGQYLAFSETSNDVLSLGIASGEVGFYKYSGIIGANRAYINISDIHTSSTPSNGYKFVFADDDLTGIETLSNAVAGAQSYYDLYGRKVAAPQKGNLYVKDGKVVKY